MALVGSGGEAIRLASGAFLVAFGLFLLLARGRIPLARALGVAHVGIGAMALATNARWDAPLLTAGLSAAGMTLASGAVVALFRIEDGGRDSVLGATFGGLVAALFAASGVWLLRDTPARFDTEQIAAGAVGLWYAAAATVYPFLAAGLALAWGLRSRQEADARRARARACMTIGLAAWPFSLLTLEAGGAGFAAGMPLGLRLVLLLTAALLAAAGIFAWARARSGPAGAWATAVALTLPISGLLTLPQVIGQGMGVDLGLGGVGRIFGVAVLAYAVFRLDALDAGFRQATMRRGASATAFLAILLMVAQVAQEFFAAQYGILLGGVVAGSFLFAAQPIQRAFERPLHAPVFEAKVAAPPERARRLYREAVRHALRDRRMTRAEEMHLTELAEELRLPASDALRLRHEVEDELQGSAP